MKDVKIVLSGSGMLYPAFVGAISRLSEAEYTISEVAGVSGGSIVAAALASGIAPGKDMENLILNTLPGPNGLIDWSWWPFARYGLIKGNKIESKFRETFVESFGETTIPLHVITCNLSKRDHKVYSSSDTPDRSIATAVRASMSIPIAFKAVEQDGDLFVDGGVAQNFPLDIFGTGTNVIGLRFRSDAGKRRTITGIGSYLLSLLDTMMESINREHIEDAVYARTVILDVEGDNLNLWMKAEEARRLIEMGYRSMDQWLLKVE